MKDAQLKKVGTLFDAIDAVVNDPEIPIDRVLIERGDGSIGVCTAGNTTKPSRPQKREYSEEELQARAAEHARLSNAIESYRIEELGNSGRILVTTTHLAAALKKTKYEIINHLKDLVKAEKLNYIIKSFAIKEDDPEYKKNVKLIDLDDLAAVDQYLENGIITKEEFASIREKIKNGITGSEDMIAPM